MRRQWRFWIPVTILHKMWGGQSWLPPAFSRRSLGAKIRASLDKAA